MVKLAPMTRITTFSPPISLRAGNKQSWGGLQGSAQALTILQGAYVTKGLSIVITTDTSGAHRLESEL